MYDPTKPFNEQIRKLIQDTHPKDGPILLRPHGKRFSIHKDPDYWKDYDEQRATDGIGTKGYLHWLMFKLTGDVRYVARGAHDAAAMAWDDLIEGGYEPYELQDHVMMQKEREDAIYSLIKELRDLCIQNSWEVIPGKNIPIAISGGETAIVNTVKGFEMGITATGKVKQGSGRVVIESQFDDRIVEY
jgi:phosphoribosylaminoimidazole (AIR) synthetase